MINGVESFRYEEEHSTDEGKEVERGLNCVTYRDNSVCYQAERKESKLFGREERV